VSSQAVYTRFVDSWRFKKMYVILQEKRKEVSSMPTQEERLGMVESDLKQFKAETLKAYRDVVMDLGMVKGLTLDTVGRLINLTKQVESLDYDMKTRFDAQDRRFEALEGHLLSFEQNTNSRFDTLEKKFDQMMQLLTATLNPHSEHEA
jgi:hypothetical protein